MVAASHSDGSDWFFAATTFTSFGLPGTLWVYPFHCLSCEETSIPDTLLLQTDGKAVLAGATNQFGSDYDVAVLRLSTVDEADSGFGAFGRVVVDRGQGLGLDVALAAALQPDEKILVAGYSEVGFAGDVDFAALRLLPDGDVDQSFGVAGWALVSFDLVDSGYDVARDLAVQPDGKIVLAGHADLEANDTDFAVARLTPDGMLDPTFGPAGSGKTTIPVPFGNQQYALAVALQGDGKILLAGAAVQVSPDIDIALARLLPDGALDPSFGVGGTILHYVDLGGSLQDTPGAIALQQDGRIVVAANAATSTGDAVVVLRLENDYVFADRFESGDASVWSTMIP